MNICSIMQVFLLFLFGVCQKKCIHIKRNPHLSVIMQGGMNYMIKSTAINNLRVGKCFFLKNFGETTSFMVLDKTSENDFRIKDLLSLETYLFSKLVTYGTGSDFELSEIDC